MAKIDEIKENINTLRVVFTVMIAVVLTITAGLIKMYYQNNFDIIFYSGVVFDITLIIAIPVLIIFIVKQTKKLRKL